MNTEQVEAWLKRRLNTAVTLKLVAMGASLFAGLLILFMSFWVWYGVIWFVSHSFCRLSHPAMLLISVGIMSLIVIVGARQNMDSLDPLGKQVRLAQDMDITLTPHTRYGMSWDTNAVNASAFEMRSMVSIINYVLCGGVLLVLGALGKLRHARRLCRVDVPGCAQVVTLLYRAARRQSFGEVVEQAPGLNPVKTFDDLRWIEGVLFLSTEPAGLILHPEMRSELDRLSVLA